GGFPVRPDASASREHLMDTAWRILNTKAMWRGAQACLALALSIVAATALSLYLFAHPVTDDFYRMSAGRDQPLFACVKQEYVGWSGRGLGTGCEYLAGAVNVPLFCSPLLLLVPAAAFFMGVCAGVRVVLPDCTRG